MYHKNEEFRRKGKDLRANQARYNKDQRFVKWTQGLFLP